MKKFLKKYFNNSKQTEMQMDEIEQPTVLSQQLPSEQHKKEDYITFALYKPIRNRIGQIIDLEFTYANNRLANIIGANPVGRLRSELLPINGKVCKYVLNVIDLNVSKHFSYLDAKFGFVNAIIEVGKKNELVNVYTIDIDAIRKDNLNEVSKKSINNILSMLNITVMHFNIAEHYVYNDSILTTYFNEDNPDLYTGSNVHSSYDLFKSLDTVLQELVENELNKLKKGLQYFASFSLIVRNSIREDIECKVVITPEDTENMYMIAVQY